MELWVSRDFEAFSALEWLADAVGQQGLDSPSLRTIVGGRCSPGSLVNWFGNKAGLHRRVVGTLGVRWGRVLTATLVPLNERDWFYARLRLAYEELARGDAEVGVELDRLVQLERDIIEWWVQSTHERTPDPRVITVLHALLVRLWDRRVNPDALTSLRLLEDVINVWIGRPVIDHPYARLVR